MLHIFATSNFCKLFVVKTGVFATHDENYLLSLSYQLIVKEDYENTNYQPF